MSTRRRLAEALVSLLNPVISAYGRESIEQVMRVILVLDAL
jgi:hypothetical protein